MGSFIPSPSDHEIIARLNFLFSKAGALTRMQSFTDRPGKIFPASHLSRVARRIGAYPHSTSDTHGRNPRARWYVFLDNLPRATKNRINTLLAQAIDPQNSFDGVIFNLTHEPGSGPPHVVDQVINFPDAQKLLFITMVCETPIPVGGGHDRPSIHHDPGGHQGNENDFWPPNDPWQTDNQ